MRLRHRHRVNHRLAHVLFELSLQHYSNIMRRILLVYMLYLGAYFIMFDRCMQLRTYRRLRLRGPHLTYGRAVVTAGFGWRAWALLVAWHRAGLVPEVGGGLGVAWLDRCVGQRVQLLAQALGRCRGTWRRRTVLVLAGRRWWP
jgi:hypothetical protein